MWIDGQSSHHSPSDAVPRRHSESDCYFASINRRDGSANLVEQGTGAMLGAPNELASRSNAWITRAVASFPLAIMVACSVCRSRAHELDADGSTVGTIFFRLGPRQLREIGGECRHACARKHLQTARAPSPFFGKAVPPVRVELCRHKWHRQEV